jgi:hypothetical protein
MQHPFVTLTLSPGLGTGEKARPGTEQDLQNNVDIAQRRFDNAALLAARRRFREAVVPITMTFGAGDLGLTLIDADGSELGDTTIGAVVCTMVRKESQGEALGVQAGDHIFSVEGSRVFSNTEGVIALITAAQRPMQMVVKRSPPSSSTLSSSLSPSSLPSSSSSSSSSFFFSSIRPPQMDIKIWSKRRAWAVVRRMADSKGGKHHRDVWEGMGATAAGAAAEGVEDKDVVAAPDAAALIASIATTGSRIGMFTVAFTEGSIGIRLANANEDELGRPDLGHVFCREVEGQASARGVQAMDHIVGFGSERTPGWTTCVTHEEAGLLFTRLPRPLSVTFIRPALMRRISEEDGFGVAAAGGGFGGGGDVDGKVGGAAAKKRPRNDAVKDETKGKGNGKTIEVSGVYVCARAGCTFGTTTKARAGNRRCKCAGVYAGDQRPKHHSDWVLSTGDGQDEGSGGGGGDGGMEEEDVDEPFPSPSSSPSSSSSSSSSAAAQEGLTTMAAVAAVAVATTATKGRDGGGSGEERGEGEGGGEDGDIDSRSKRQRLTDNVSPS